MRRSPYSTHERGITFVSGGIEINQTTNTIHPTRIKRMDQVESEDLDSEGDLVNPSAYSDPVEQAHFKETHARIFVSQDVGVSHDEPPLCVEVEKSSKPPKLEDTSVAAKKAIDIEQERYQHLPINQEFSQKNLEVALGKASPGTDDVYPRPPELGHGKASPRVGPAGLLSTDVPQSMGEARFPKRPGAPRARSMKRARDSPSSAGTLSPIEETSKRLASVPRLNLTMAARNADRDDTTPTSSIAESGVPSTRVVAARAWAHFEAHNAAEALGRMDLGSDQPMPRK